MNALPNATAHAQLNGPPHAPFSGASRATVHAKRSEGKGPEGKGPDLKFFGLATKTNAYSGRALKRGRVVAGSLIGFEAKP